MRIPGVGVPRWPKIAQEEFHEAVFELELGFARWFNDCPTQPSLSHRLDNDLAVLHGSSQPWVA